ncbi:sensor histidine kinase [Candidatus Moduliflexota bacterium]
MKIQILHSSKFVVSVTRFLVCLAALIPPLGYYFFANQQARGSLSTEIDWLSREFTAVISRNPDMWHYEKDRLEAILDIFHERHEMERHVILDHRGGIVAEIGGDVKMPVITASRPIMDSGMEVGRLVITRSVRPHLTNSIIVMTVTLCGAAVLLYVLQKGLFETYENAEKELLVYQQKLQSLVSSLSAAEDRERRDLAMVLHDDISQILAMCKAKLEDPPGGKGGAGKVRDAAGARRLLEQAIDRSRDLTSDLSSQTLYELGLPQAVEDYCRTVENRQQLAVAFKKSGDMGVLSPEIRGLLYRAVRELLTNVVKHAGAERALVELKADAGHVRLAVLDDGRGLEDSAFPDAGMIDLSKGYGLFSIREQVRTVGGKFEIETIADGGVRVILTVPMEQRKRRSPDGGGNNPAGA